MIVLFGDDWCTGKGALGVAIPGCPETFEEPQEQSNRRGSRSQKQQLQDSHQKIRHFNEGDVLVIPPGVPYWTYNTGDEPVVAISLLDTSNFNNQLDQNPRVRNYNEQWYTCHCIVSYTLKKTPNKIFFIIIFFY